MLITEGGERSEGRVDADTFIWTTWLRHPLTHATQCLQPQTFIVKLRHRNVVLPLRAAVSGNAC